MMTEEERDIKRWRSEVIGGLVSDTTNHQYARQVKEIISIGGSLTYEGFLKFSFIKASTLKGSTLAGYKAAMGHALRMIGTPLSSTEDKDLNLLMQGLAARSQPRRRGALDEEKLAAIVDEAWGRNWPEVARGYVLMKNCLLRPRDVRELTWSNVDLNEGLVWVRSKKSRVKRVREGDLEPHPIGPGARIILNQLLPLRNGEYVLPNFPERRARSLIKEVAVREGWNANLLWDGMHTLRHGGAVDKLKEALKFVQVAGGWRTEGSAAHYSRLRR